MRTFITHILLRHGQHHCLRKSSSMKLCYRAKHSQQNDFFTNQQFQNNSTNSDNLSFNEPRMELDMPVDIPVFDDRIHSVIEPTLKSLGLCAHTPAGLIQRGMEFLHISADMPWWGVIVTSAVVIRLSLLPIVIRNRKAMVQYINTMADVQKMTNEVTEAKDRGDFEQVTRLAMQRQNALTKIPFKDMFILPLFVQGGVLMSTLVGLRGMATLPVESMCTGGLTWFQDLTVADPYFILPLISSVSYLVVIETGAESGGQEMNPVLKRLFRFIAPVIFVCTMKFQSAVTLYFGINSIITLIQAQVLRNPAIKQACGIREIRKDISIGTPMEKKSFADGFKEAMETAEIIDKMTEKERIKELEEKIEKLKKKQAKK